MKLRCYFVYPKGYKDAVGINRIKEEMVSRRLEVIEPLLNDNKIVEEFGLDRYYSNETWTVARKIWTQRLKLLASSDIVISWVPDFDYIPLEIPIAYKSKKFIQIISPTLHPSFSVYASEKQYFTNIDNWIHRRDYKWRK